MNWNLEGKTINGLYIGLFPFQGKVTNSRVKYGGMVSHTVLLDKPMQVYGEDRTTIIVEQTDVNRILSDADVEFYANVSEQEQDNERMFREMLAG